MSAAVHIATECSSAYSDIHMITLVPGTHVCATDSRLTCTGKRSDQSLGMIEFPLATLPDSKQTDKWLDLKKDGVTTGSIRVKVRCQCNCG